MFTEQRGEGLYDCELSFIILNYCKLYTYPNIKIRTKSDNDNFTDTVIFEDKEYEVVSRDFFRSGLISHNKYILQEITNNEGDEENASEL